jgi:hypothetical protein
MPIQIFWLLFVSAMTVTCAFIIVSSAALPDMVAASFNADGVARGLIAKTDYRNLILATTSIIGVSHGAVFGLISKLPTSSISMPNRDYWLSKERRESTMQYFAKFGILLGIIVVLMIAGLHWCVLVAHRGSSVAVPPVMPNTMQWAIIGSGLTVIAVMLVLLMRRFSAPQASALRNR